MSHYVHVLSLRPEDEGRGCCMGAVALGRCTCWKAQYDRPQEPPRTDLRPSICEDMCGTCAFRPDSPEMTSSDHVAADRGDLERLVFRGETFYCHRSMRVLTHYLHPDGSVRRSTKPGKEYVPVFVGDVPYNVDGTPAAICAGWAAARAALREKG